MLNFKVHVPIFMECLYIHAPNYKYICKLSNICGCVAYWINKHLSVHLTACKFIQCHYTMCKGLKCFQMKTCDTLTAAGHGG